jgi:hypothetical protein
MNRGFRAAAPLCVLLSISLAACGGGKSPPKAAKHTTATNPSGDVRPAAPTAPTSSTTTTTTSPTASYANTWTFTAGASGGYTESGTISFGQAEKFHTGIKNGNVVAGSGCSVNPQTDAVVPYRFSVTNTTQGFSITPGLSVSDVNAGIAWEVGGGQCIPVNGDWDSKCPSTSPGQSCTYLGFAVLSGYYSPSFPDGNPAFLTAPLQSFPEPFAVFYTTFSGPGTNVPSAFTLSGMPAPAD